MRTLALFLLLTAIASAQQMAPPEVKNGVYQHKMPSMHTGRYADFSVIKVPHCAAPRKLNGQQTCRVFVRFKRELLTIPVRRFIFYTEDWTNKPDSLEHIKLTCYSSKGMWIEAIPGHDIWWQVNVR